MRGFIQFIREQGVVGLTIGFVLGGAVSKVVTSLVTDVINPLVGLVVGNTEGLAAVTLGVVHLGSFISVLVDALIIATVVYFGFKWLRLERLDVKKEG